MKKGKLSEAKDSLSSYNKKYESIGRKTTELKNVYKMLRFAKGLERMTLLTRKLRSLTKDDLIHRLKIAELLK